jgi:uncharacterized protein (TIGR03083 family)
VEIHAHIDALRVEGRRMAAAAAQADPDGGVPTCPEWTVRDLVRHTGGVHRWATGFVTSGRADPADEDLVESWPADQDLVAWLRQGCADLVAALVAAPDDLQCWIFLPAPSPRAMWSRRQAHETAIHRVDTELAVGAEVSRFDPPFAADGVDELLQLFVPRRSIGLRAESPTTLAVRCTDVDACWLLHLDADGVRTSASQGGGDGGAKCTLSGSADDLYLALWNRVDAQNLLIEGDRQVLQQFSEVVRIIWA